MPCRKLKVLEGGVVVPDFEALRLLEKAADKDGQHMTLGQS